MKAKTIGPQFTSSHTCEYQHYAAIEINDVVLLNEFGAPLLFGDQNDASEYCLTRQLNLVGMVDIRDVCVMRPGQFDTRFPESESA